MKRFLTILLACSFFSVPIGAPADEGEIPIRERKTCQKPPGSYRKSGKIRTFTLEDGMRGRCSSDHKPRTRNNGEVEPFKERSELGSRVFNTGQHYRVIEEIQFDPSTTSAPRTTFFQIHQTPDDKSCNPGPALMLAIDEGRVRITRRANGGSKDSHRSYRQDWLPVTRTQLTKWTKLEVDFYTSPDRLNPVKVYMNGHVVYSGQVWFDACGTPYMKTGLYRPGSATGSNPTDRLRVNQPRYIQYDH